MTKELAVVMPAYNEASAIEETVSEMRDVLENEGINYQIIVSEDGSNDGTKEILERMEEEDRIKAVMGDERRGYTGALKAGLEEADAEYVLFADGDGQYYAEDFLDLWEGHDEAPVVIGRRSDRADSFGRRLISDTFQFVVENTMEFPDIEDMTSSFRLIEKQVAEQVILEIKHMRDSSWTEFAIRAHYEGFKQVEVSVRHRKRPGEGDTRIYHLSNLPSVVLRQLIGLWNLRAELKQKN